MDTCTWRSGDSYTASHNQAHSQKRPFKKPPSTWLCWSHTHSRIMATHHTPYFSFPCCRWFWCIIHRQSIHIPPSCCTGKTLWNIWILDRGIILCHQNKVELWQIHKEKLWRYLHVQIHHKTISRTPTWDIKPPTIFAINLSPEEIRRGGTRTNKNRWLQARFLQSNKPRAEKRLQNPILWKVRWYHYSHGTINIGDWKIQSNNANNK